MCNTLGVPSPMWLLWDWMGSDHWEFHGLVLWAMHWDSMGLHWDWSLGIPWNCSMGNALGFHGLALGLLIGYSMEVLYG